MTAYNFPPAMLSFSAFNEAKEKRRQVLEAVQERRKIIYQRYLRKLRTPSPTS